MAARIAWVETESTSNIIVRTPSRQLQLLHSIAFHQEQGVDVLKPDLSRSESPTSIVPSPSCLIRNSHTVNFAPVFPSLIEPELNDSLPFLSYDPRCLKRDVSSWVSSNWTKDVDIADLINQNPDIYWFQTIMQGNGFIDGFFGVHAAGKSFHVEPNLTLKIALIVLTYLRTLHNRW
jgi:hypothetical protein